MLLSEVAESRRFGRNKPCGRFDKPLSKNNESLTLSALTGWHARC